MNELLKHKLLKRIEKAQKVLGHSVEGIKYDSKIGISEISCRLCGTVMSGLVEYDGKPKKERIEKRLVITRRMVLAYFPSYAQIEMLMDNGDKHISHVCKTCLAKGLTNEQLEIMYVGDLAQFLHEYRTTGGEPIWETMPRILDNVPVSYVEQKVG